MEQILNKLVKQNSKMKKDIRKIYNNKKINEEKTNEIKRIIKTFKRAIRNRKQHK